MTKTFTCRRYKTVGTFEYSADFAQAASGITVRFPDGNDEWQPTPFQVADARHDRRRAERLIADYFR